MPRGHLGLPLLGGGLRLLLRIGNGLEVLERVVQPRADPSQPVLGDIGFEFSHRLRVASLLQRLRRVDPRLEQFKLLVSEILLGKNRRCLGVLKVLLLIHFLLY